MGSLKFRNANEMQNWSTVFNQAFAAECSAAAKQGSFNAKGAVYDACAAADYLILSVRLRSGEPLIDAPPLSEALTRQAPVDDEAPMPADDDAPEAA